MEEQGLASVMTYGNGTGNTVKHYYAGDQKKKKKEGPAKVATRGKLGQLAIRG